MKKFLITMLLMFIACGGNKNEEKFLDMMGNVKFLEPMIVTAFTDDWTSIIEEDDRNLVEYKLNKVFTTQNGWLIGKYTNEVASVYLGFTDDPFGNSGYISLYTSGAVYDNLTDEVVGEALSRAVGHPENAFYLGEIPTEMFTVNTWKVGKRVSNGGWNIDSFDIFSHEYREYYYKTYYGDNKFNVYLDKKRECFIIEGARFLSIDLADNRVYYYRVNGSSFRYMGFDDERAISIIIEFDSYLGAMYKQEGNSVEIQKIRKIITQAKRIINDKSRREITEF